MSEEIQKRGKLTERIKVKSRELLDRDFGQVELRLMAYVQYVMMNGQRIEPRKVSQEERDVLQKWKEGGHIKGGAGGMSITKEFWDIMNELLFLGYVDIES